MASAGDLLSSIIAQGEAVRQLKAAKAAKEEVDKAVQQLLALKVRRLQLNKDSWLLTQAFPTSFLCFFAGSV